MLLIPLAAMVLSSPADGTGQRPAAYELTWVAPGGCPGEEQLREQIAELAPNPSGGEGVMFVAATVVERPGGFTVRIATDFAGHRDERTAESESCTDLGDATALLVAVTLEPGAKAPEKPVSLTPVVPQPPIPEPAPLAHPARPETPRPQADVDSERPTERHAPQPVSVADPNPYRPVPPQAVHLRIEPLVEYGSLPSLDGGAAVSVGTLWPRWRAELFGIYLLPQRHTFGRTRTLLQLGAAGARACHRLFAGPLEFPICLGVEAGAMRAQTQGQRPQSALNLAWFAPSARAGVAYGGKRVGVFAAGELAVATMIPQVRVGDARAFQSRPVALRASAGLEIFFAIDPR